MRNSSKTSPVVPALLYMRASLSQRLEPGALLETGSFVTGTVHTIKLHKLGQIYTNSMYVLKYVLNNPKELLHEYRLP